MELRRGPIELIWQQYPDIDALNANPPPDWQWQAIRLGNFSQGFIVRTTQISPTLQVIRISSATSLSIRIRCPGDTIALSLSTDSATRLNGQSLQLYDIGLLTFGTAHQLVIGPATDLLLIGTAADQRLVSKSHNQPVTKNAFPADRLSLKNPDNSMLLTSIVQKTAIATLDDADLTHAELNELLTAVVSMTDVESPFRPLPIRHRAALEAADVLSADLRSNTSIGGLCATMGICERLLRKGFSEWFGTSPSGYAKGLRLQHIRARLKALSRLDASITSIATEWGVTHMGRFSADYRQYFGEYPNKTLQRVWSGNPD